MPTTKHWTSKDLDALPHKEGTRYEIINGELYVSYQPSWHHQYACRRLIAVLDHWSLATGLGEPSGAPGIIFRRIKTWRPTSSGSATAACRAL